MGGATGTHPLRLRDIEVMRCVQDDTRRPSREEVRSQEIVIIRINRATFARVE